MRIGVNTLFLVPGKVGGSETYLRETLQSVVAGHPEVELVLFTNLENHGLFSKMFDSTPQAECHGLDFHATNRFTRVLREQIQLPMVARQAQVDVLWSPGYTAPLLCHCPQVVTIHDMQYKEHPEDFAPHARLVLGILVRMSARHCKSVITDSEFAKKQILQHASVAEHRITVVQPGVSPRFSPKEPTATLREHARSLLKTDRPYLLFVGNTYPHKNVSALTQAFGTIQRDTEHSLVIVGTPDRGEDLLAQATANLEDPSRLIRLGYVSEEDLTTLYAAADLFVFPSLYEGFGLPVLEAMMAGTPVLTTRCAAVPEVGGDCVRYFDETSEDNLATAIREMVTMSQDERRQLADKARTRAGRFTWERTARETLEVFQGVLR